jgi:hypothetical protein
MCQLCRVASITQKLKSRSRQMQNTTQFSTVVLGDQTLNLSPKK